jgi:PleD family two-component response regulator
MVNSCPCKNRPEILIVDDNEFNVLALKNILELTYNLSSDKASNGQDAIDKLLARE